MLLNEIALEQALHAVAAEPFQTWRLQVRPNYSALLTCDDGNSNIIHSKKIVFTDFPLKDIALYFTDNIIMLTSEH